MICWWIEQRLNSKQICALELEDSAQIAFKFTIEVETYSSPIFITHYDNAQLYAVISYQIMYVMRLTLHFHYNYISLTLACQFIL